MDQNQIFVRLTAAQQGDKDAFGDVVDHYGDVLVRYLTRLVHDRILAEDVAQETLIRAYRALPKLRDIRRFSPWLMRIARCAAIDAHRRRFTRQNSNVEEVLKEDMDSDFHAPEVQFDKESYDKLLNRIRSEIHDLPEATRVLVLRRYSENASYESLASDLGLTVPQVKARLNRARNRLRIRLVELLPEWKQIRHELP